jgi:nifR3 family TIM-barrel protein
LPVNNSGDVAHILKHYPVALAPMAGVTDKTFRTLAREQGPVLLYTEMISAKALSYHNAKTLQLLDIGGETWPVAVQLFGSEPAEMAAAAQAAAAQGAAFVDVNMGCPVPKVVKNGEGAALLEKPELAARIVEAMALAVNIPVTVKLRLGMDSSRLPVPDFALRMEAAGAAMLAVHSRTREQYYSGRADWQQLRRIKEAVKVPVVGNGDVRTPQDALRMLGETGCDGVMIGRAALGNPWLAGRIANFLLTGDEGREPGREEKLAMALEHCRRLVERKGEAKAIPEMRKHLAWYLKGLPGMAPVKERLFRCRTLAEAESILLAAPHVKERGPNAGSAQMRHERHERECRRGLGQRPM